MNAYQRRVAPHLILFVFILFLSVYACMQVGKICWGGRGGGGVLPVEMVIKQSKLLRMSWNTFWFWNCWKSKKIKNLQRCPPNFFLKNTNVTNTGFLPFVLIVSQNNAYREGCKQEWIKIDQIVLF